FGRIWFALYEVPWIQMIGGKERFRRTLGGYCNEGMAWRRRDPLRHPVLILFVVNVGSDGCLQAVGLDCGLIMGDCEPDRALVGAQCEPKTPLVCEPIAHCLRAITPTVPFCRMPRAWILGRVNALAPPAW